MRPGTSNGSSDPRTGTIEGTASIIHCAGTGTTPGSLRTPYQPISPALDIPTTRRANYLLLCNKMRKLPVMGGGGGASVVVRLFSLILGVAFGGQDVARVPRVDDCAYWCAYVECIREQTKDTGRIPFPRVPGLHTYGVHTYTVDQLGKCSGIAIVKVKTFPREHGSHARSAHTCAVRAKTQNRAIAHFRMMVHPRTASTI